MYYQSPDLVLFDSISFSFPHFPPFPFLLASPATKRAPTVTSFYFYDVKQSIAFLEYFWAKNFQFELILDFLCPKDNVSLSISNYIHGT